MDPGSWIHGEPDHRGDVIAFEQLASGCTRGEAIRRLRALVRLPQIASHGFLRSARLPPAQHQQLRRMSLDFLERGTAEDLKRLAALRCLAREALEISSDAGVLRFATLRGRRAWIATDQMRCVAEARRLDGKVWEHIGGKKAWTLPGGNKKWPLGIFEAQNSRVIVLVEGSADFIAAYHCIWAEARRDVAPVAILGASMSIHPVALRLFKGKRVRIFPHYDEKGFHGFDAARKWEAQLQSVGAVVDCFDLSGLTRSDDRCVCDLNDLCSVSYEQWQSEVRDILP
jgi:hypothetical protein